MILTAEGIWLCVTGAALLVLGLWGISQAWFGFAAKKWPTTRGRILYAGVEQIRGPRGGGKARVQYEYNVCGVTYKAKRFRFGGVGPFGYAVMRAEVDALIGAGQVDVFYDPANPRRTCLKTGSNAITLPAATFVLLMGLGLLWMVAVVAGLISL